MKPERIITFSEMSTFTRCPRKWEFAYRKQLVPKIEDVRLSIGKIGHIALAVYYTTGSRDQAEAKALEEIDKTIESAKRNKADASRIEELEEKSGILRALLSGYFDFYKDDANKYEHVYSEKQMGFPITDPQKNKRIYPRVRYTGVIDGIWRTKDGHRTPIIVEHKFLASFDDDINNLMLDFQISCYMLLSNLTDKESFARQFGEIRTVLYNVVVKPQNRRKQGESSEEFIARVAAAIKENPAKYYRRITLHRGKEQIIEAYNEILKLVKITREDKKLKERIYRSVQPTCKWECPYKTLCYNENPALVETGFKKKEQRHVELDRKGGEKE